MAKFRKEADQFIDFLIQYGAFDAWVENCKQGGWVIDIHEFLARAVKDDYIVLAFNWRDTKEVDEYWTLLHYKWGREIKK